MAKKERPKISVSQLYWTLHRLLKVFFANGPILLPFLLGLNLAIALVPASQIWVGKLIIDDLVNLITSSTAATEIPWPILTYLLIEVGLFLLNNLLTNSERHLRLKLGFRNEVSIRALFLDKCDQLPYRLFEDPKFHDDITVLEQQVFNGVRRATDAFLSTFRNCIQLLTVIGLLGHLSPWIVVVLVAVNGLHFGLNSNLVKTKYKLDHILSKRYRKNKYLSSLFVHADRIQEIKVLDSGKYLINLFLKNAKFTNRQQLKVSKKQTSLQFAMGALGGIAYYGFYVLTIWRAIIGVFTIGDIGLYQRCYRSFGQTLKSLVNNLMVLHERSIYFTKFFTFLSYEEKSPVVQTGFSEKIKTLSFKNVSFTYPGAASSSLKNVNFEAKRGETIAIVGANGAGKSTFVKLLVGLFEPSRGQIQVNGKSIGNIDHKDYLAKLGIALQQTNRYELSFKENLSMGKLSELHNDKLLMETISKYDLDEVFSKLPSGLNTCLSKSYENGHQISGGEWQKLNMAKVLFKNPEVLILDEPASNTDPHYRKFLSDLIGENRQSQDKIIIMISHELNFATVADRIVVMDQGSILETGTHQHLIDSGELYQGLWQSRDQAAQTWPS